MFPKHTERFYNEKHSKKENKRHFKTEKGYILRVYIDISK